MIILIGIKYSGLAISAKLRLWSSIKISSNPCPILANIIAHGERPIIVVKKNFELLAPSPARIKFWAKKECPEWVLLKALVLIHFFGSIVL